jgi:hypothetical protein
MLGEFTCEKDPKNKRGSNRQDGDRSPRPHTDSAVAEQVHRCQVKSRHCLVLNIRHQSVQLRLVPIGFVRFEGPVAKGKAFIRPMSSRARRPAAHAERSAVQKAYVNTRSLLRIPIVHKHEVDVDRCLQGFEAAHFRIDTDVAKARASLGECVDSKFYDLIVEEYSTVDWQEAGMPQTSPCIR